MLHKIALGTVQLGLNYGINNKKGKPNLSEAQDILRLAQNAGIDTLDTAQSYGNSEEIIGQSAINKFKIVSKISHCSFQDVIAIFNDSLAKLNTSKIYGYLIHNFNTYNNDNKIWKELLKLKSSGKVEKIGFSIYSIKELEILFDNNVELDLVQFPYNLFDRQFEKYFEELKQRDIEIHIRSSFLQGLFFKSPDSLHNHFLVVKEKITALQKLALEYNMTIAEFCLKFALNNDYVSKVVIGVDSKAQLSQNINSIKGSTSFINLSQVEFLKEQRQEITNPGMWKIL